MNNVCICKSYTERENVSKNEIVPFKQHKNTVANTQDNNSNNNNKTSDSMKVKKEPKFFDEFDCEYDFSFILV